MTYETYDPNPAATVRTALKNELGYTSRQVSVKGDGGSVRVMIKDITCDESRIAEIANRSRRVRYDEATGCILRGGNTFVSVDWDRRCVEAMMPALDPAEFAEDGAYVRLGRVHIAREAAYQFRLYVHGSTQEEDDAIEARLSEMNLWHRSCYDLDGARQTIAAWSLAVGMDLAAAVEVAEVAVATEATEATEEAA